MKNVYIEFDILEESKRSSPMHIYMLCHMIFDVNMDFTMKYRYVATGCHAHKSDESRYSGAVSCGSIHIAFIYGNTNGIDIMAAYTHNFYLTTSCYDNYWTRCGPEF